MAFGRRLRALLPTNVNYHVGGTYPNHLVLGARGVVQQVLGLTFVQGQCDIGLQVQVGNLVELDL